MQQVDIMEGKVVTQEEVFKGPAWAWGEVHSFKFLPSIRTHLTNGAQITGNVSLVCSKVCLRSWAFWSLLSRSKGLGLYTGLGKGEDKGVVLQPFTATSDQAMVQGSCLWLHAHCSSKPCEDIGYFHSLLSISRAFLVLSTVTICLVGKSRDKRLLTADLLSLRPSVLHDTFLLRVS